MIFPASVELWRPLVNEYAGDLPVDFLLKWIQKESNGNPCSWTTLFESGIFQLMRGGNISAGGTTESALRAACVEGTSKLARTLTPAEAREQVRSGIQYVRWARDDARRKLAAASARWPESSSDFGKMVKWAHVAPGKTAPWLAAATVGLGRPPANWKELVPFAPAVGIPSHWVLNATEVGDFWTGGGISLVTIGLLVGAAAVVYYVAARRR